MGDLVCLDVQKRTVFDGMDPNNQREILSIQSEIEKNILTIKANIYDIGKLLAKAKKILPHGGFEPWIQETFGRELPYPTAALFKSIYEKFKDHPEVVKLLPISFLQTIKQGTFPDAVLALIRENPQAFAQTDIKGFLQIFRDYKGGKLNLDGFEKLAKKQIEIGLDLLQGETHLRHSLRAKRTCRYGLQSLKGKLKELNDFVTKINFLLPPTDAPDTQLITDIDHCIGQLTKLKVEITQGHGLLRPILVERNAVVKKEWETCKNYRFEEGK